MTTSVAAVASLLAAATALAGGPYALAQGCAPDWDYTHGDPGMSDGYVSSFATYDDGAGAGPRLYAAGSFTTVSGGVANRVAVWDGAAWQPLSGGVDDNWVNALITWDDGSGEALYVGGFYTSVDGVAGTTNIAKWDGSTWTALQQGVNLDIASVWSLAVYDDGAGEDLYAGGNFYGASGVSTSLIARWDGANWSDVGGGLEGVVGSAIVLAMTIYDDGNGPALYCGGRFTSAANGSVPVSQIAKWDGSMWSSVGGGITGTQVLGLGVYNGSLYACGTFTAAGGVPAVRIAGWNGAAWSALGAGLSSTTYAVRSFDDGSGPALYACGAFTSAGGNLANRFAKWDGANWSAIGDGLVGGTAFGLHVHDGALFAGGSFTSANTMTSNRVATWRGCPVSNCPADFDGDGVVGAGDLAILLGAWGGAAGDLDGDMNTSASDLALLLGAWGPCA